MAKHTNSRLKFHYKIGVSQNKPRSLMNHFLSGRGVKMLFMPGDPLNSGCKLQGCFSVLDVLGDGRVEQRLFTENSISLR